MSNPVGWARGAEKPSEHLDKMLSVAVTNYAKQTDWFLHHRDTGIKHLAVVLGAQISMTSVTLSNHYVPAWLAIATLIFLGVVGPFLAVSAIRSAESSYRASIEYAVLITKSLWALGLTNIVDVADSRTDMKTRPAAYDECFYILRHIRNHASAQDCTTEEIVSKVLSSKGNTLCWAKRVITTFSFAVSSMAILGSFAIFAKI